jgi:hypothetical protein
MDGIRNAQAVIDPWWSYLAYCFNGDPLSTVCGPFWQRIIVGVIVIGCVGVLFGAWKYYRYRRAAIVARIAEWEREQADVSAIKESTWDGDKAYQSELPDAEVQRRIREGLDQRRASNSAASKPT